MLIAILIISTITLAILGLFLFGLFYDLFANKKTTTEILSSIETVSLKEELMRREKKDN